MACIVNGNEIVLTGTVGGYYWEEDGFSSADVFMALLAVGRNADVIVRVNSGGGAASEGAAIHSALANHGGRVDVVVEGWAASAASLLAMAGKTVTMSLGATMMIHDPAGITFGDVAEHVKKINQLNAIGDAAAEIYAKKTGKSVEEMRTVMKTERWLTGQEAVSEGFADRIGVADATADIEPITFAIETYKHVPERIASIATARGWKPRATKPAVSAAPPSQTQENPMTDKERADQLANELAALQSASKTNADALAALQAEKDERDRKDAIMALPEVAGRETLATALAGTAGMTPDAAKTILLTLPKAAAGNAPDEVAELERRRLNGSGLNTSGGDDKPSKASAILANYRAVTGTTKRA